MLHKEIIYKERHSTICVRIPTYLKTNLEEYTKKYKVSQADVIICLLAELNMLKDITRKEYQFDDK